MTDKFFESIMVIASGVIGLAILAVIFSKNAATATVLQQGGNAFANIINAAVSPVTGASVGSNGLGQIIGAVGQSIVPQYGPNFFTPNGF